MSSHVTQAKMLIKCQCCIFSCFASFTALGHFMYVDSVYSKHFQEVAKLTSPMTTVPMEGCLSFYFHRKQERGNIFSVFTRDQLGVFEEIWRPEVIATAGWTLVYIDIKALHPQQVSTKIRIQSDYLKRHCTEKENHQNQGYST